MLCFSLFTSHHRLARNFKFLRSMEDLIQLAKEDEQLVSTVQNLREMVSDLTVDNEKLRYKLRSRPVQRVVVEKVVNLGPQRLTRKRPMIINKVSSKTPPGKQGKKVKTKKIQRAQHQDSSEVRKSKATSLLSLSQANVALSQTNRALQESQGEYLAVVRSLQERIDDMAQQQETDILQFRKTQDDRVATIKENARRDVEGLTDQLSALQGNISVLTGSHERLAAENELLKTDLRENKTLLEEARIALREETAACEAIIKQEREHRDNERVR